MTSGSPPVIELVFFWNGLSEIPSGSVALWKWSLSVAIPVVLH